MTGTGPLAAGPAAPLAATSAVSALSALSALSVDSFALGGRLYDVVMAGLLVLFLVLVLLRRR